MKPRNREINVFSMSALDLFASAMGAFMFLAIISLPFFPNTGSSEESIEIAKQKTKELEAELEEHKKDLESTQKELQKANNDLAKAKSELEEGITKLPIELVITIDNSGSMAVPIDRLKDAIKRLTLELPKVSEELRIGIVSYGGDGDFNKIEMQVINDSTRKQFISQVEAITLASGDTDVPEAVNEAMTMFSLPNKKVRKAFVLIGDVGPYEMIGTRNFNLYDISQSRANRLIRNGQDVTVDKRYESQVFDSVNNFVASNKLRSVMAMYTGNATRRGDSSYQIIALTRNNSTEFFKRIAELGGDENGHYSEEPSDMLSMLLIAVLSAS